MIDLWPYQLSPYGNFKLQFKKKVNFFYKQMMILRVGILAQEVTHQGLRHTKGRMQTTL